MEIIVLLWFVLIYFILLAFSVVTSVLQVIAQWKLFEKAGEHGWTSLIPIYNYFVMNRIATGSNFLGWIYVAVCVLYVVFTTAVGFLLEFSDTDFYLKILMILISSAFTVALYTIAGYASYMFGKSYGKQTAWNVCMIFFAPILIIIMGFDKNISYIGAKGIPKNL